MPLAAQRPRPSPVTTVDRVAVLREVQAAWRATPLARRVDVARRMRRRIAAREDELLQAVRPPWRSSPAETLSAELLPLADACRFAARTAPELLRARRPGSRGRPLWLWGSDVEVSREPWGVVLILGPANYPFLLPGVQALQAVIAGNAVIIKPGRGARPAAECLARLFVESGAPPGLVLVLDDSVEAARDAIAAGVDRVVLTGSAATGRELLGNLAAGLTPAVMELSGCDAVFVGQDADLDLAARALRFGLCLNGGFTCIAPRRVFVAAGRAAELETRLAELLADCPAVALEAPAVLQIEALVRDALDHGARRVLPSQAPLPADGVATVPCALYPTVLADVRPEMRIASADVGAPVLSILPVRDDRQALEWSQACGYRLGATIFGDPGAARRLAARVDAGVVVVNDMIVPTADPRVPFGGRGDSGYGVTRGAEGLLDMTRPKTLIVRRGRFRPHFDPAGSDEQRLLSAYLRAAHGGSVATRLRAAAELLRRLVGRARRGAKE